MEVLADSKIRKYEKEEYLSVVSFNSKWQYILHVVSLQVFKYSRYIQHHMYVHVYILVHVHACIYMYI